MNSYKLPGTKCQCGEVHVLPASVPIYWIRYFYMWELCQKCGRQIDKGSNVIASVSVEYIGMSSRPKFTITEFIPDWK